MRTQRETPVWKATTKASRANQSCQNSWLGSYFLSDHGGVKYPEYLICKQSSVLVLSYRLSPPTCRCLGGRCWLSQWQWWLLCPDRRCWSRREWSWHNPPVFLQQRWHWNMRRCVFPYTCITVVASVDQPGYEVAGHGDEEGVGEDGYPGQADHDVVPDANIVHKSGCRLPITYQHLLCIQPEHYRGDKSIFFFQPSLIDTTCVIDKVGFNRF